MSATQQRRRTPVRTTSTGTASTVKRSPSPRVQQKSKWHWSLTLTLAFFFPSFLAILAFKDVVLITWAMILICVLSIGGLAAVAQLSWFKKMRRKSNEGDHLVIGKQLYFAYNIFGIGVLATALMLTLNYLVTPGEPTVVVHKIIGQDRDYNASSGSGIVYLLEDNAFADEPELRWFETKTNMLKQTHPYVRYYFTNGLFGFENLGERFMTTDENASEEIEQPYL